MIKTLWQFSRPHTIIGSICSIVTLYILVLGQPLDVPVHLPLLGLTLFAALACNVFIVGLNQIIDVELDVINKPKLPIPAGKLSVRQATIICSICMVLAVAIGFYTSYILGWLIILISVLGIVYSVPPIQLKKHHLPAAICITVVRGFLVNVGMYVHFRYVIFDVGIAEPMPSFMWPLVLFVIAFSIAIAWFKDLPDTKGDATFNFKTLAVLYSPKLAAIAGCAVVIAAYLYCIIWAVLAHQLYLCYAHILLCSLFVANIFFLKLAIQKSITSFYLRFWVLFFLEYILFAIWALRN